MACAIFPRLPDRFFRPRKNIVDRDKMLVEKREEVKEKKKEKEKRKKERRGRGRGEKKRKKKEGKNDQLVSDQPQPPTDFHRLLFLFSFPLPPLPPPHPPLVFRLSFNRPRAVGTGADGNIRSESGQARLISADRGTNEYSLNTFFRF